MKVPRLRTCDRATAAEGRVGDTKARTCATEHRTRIDSLSIFPHGDAQLAEVPWDRPTTCTQRKKLSSWTQVPVRRECGEGCSAEPRVAGIMPTRVFINILQARSLPVMDRATGLCDAYVKVSGPLYPAPESHREGAGLDPEPSSLQGPDNLKTLVVTVASCIRDTSLLTFLSLSAAIAQGSNIRSAADADGAEDTQPCMERAGNETCRIFSGTGICRMNQHASASPARSRCGRLTLIPILPNHFLQFKCDVTDDCLLQDEPLQVLPAAHLLASIVPRGLDRRR
jgi:hypothetical protein